MREILFKAKRFVGGGITMSDKKGFIVTDIPRNMSGLSILL